MNNYNHQIVEAKWQKFWQANDTFLAKVDYNKKKFYCLEMLPYPSGRIHMGHLRNYSIGDAIARLKKMQGYNVLHPMGWDAFGLPAENAAIEGKIHPQEWTLHNIENMRKSIKSMGASYDWSKEITTCLPNYYRYSQEIFLEFFANNLTYRKEAEVNWDPVDNTVLSNEQVIDGKGWRSGAIVEKRKLKQWFIKVTNYADELYEGLDKLPGWSQALKATQSKWIGKSQGLNIKFSIIENNEQIEVYTTRHDTIYGMSFLAISPFHPLIENLAKDNIELKNFVEKCKQGGTAEAEIEKKEKEGLFINLHVNHPFTNEKIPIYVANFVLMEYGTGAIFGCPAHDERDFSFAKKYNLPIKQVIAGDQTLPFNNDAKIINSDFLNGLTSKEAKEKVALILGERNIGKKVTNFRLRDWGISRQRYWGAPIPIIYCKICGEVPVPKEDLPVELPKDVDFSGSGNPLANHPTWKNTNCPKCGAASEREVDTFDTFFESSWYFLRYCNPDSKNIIDKEAVKYWMNVDCYVGGIEHAVLHLLYARFFVKALRDIGYLDFDEPFKEMLNQGMVLHETYKDKDGKWLYPEEAALLKADEVSIGRAQKMSKSKKNVIDPEKLIAEFGADAARFFMLSDSPYERDLDWSQAGIEGAAKFLHKLWRYIDEFLKIENKNSTEILSQYEKKIAILTDQASKNYQQYGFNTAIANIRELANLIFDIDKNHIINHSTIRYSIKNMALLLAPIAPHIAEEIWHLLGYKNSVFEQKWPEIDKNLLIMDIYKLAVQVNGKLRATIEVDKNSTKEEIEELALNIDNVQKFIAGKIVKKIIIVPGKIVNVVV